MSRASSFSFSDPDLLTGRLFFAVPVPGPARAPLEALLPELGRALPGARLPVASGWHLTVAFLGSVRPEEAGAVVEVGETAAASTTPADLQLHGAGAFPNPRRARVLWAGVGGQVETLVSLAATLAAACREAGLRFEERELVPHLTLARLPQPAPLPEPVVDMVTAAAATSRSWRARELCCYRSILSRAGARYQVIRRFPLAG
jgi:RNA 2',3'-cyclic 3'-phosphodiesterase